MDNQIGGYKKMGDSVIDSYVHSLLNAGIEEEKFELYIDIFSRFLAYINSNYKYNGTYLSQYINDFKRTYYALINKKKMYDEIISKIVGIGRPFELILDDVYMCTFLTMDHIEIKFINFNKNKIINKSIEVKVTIEYMENKFLFWKEYLSEDNQISNKIMKDIKTFIKMKKIRRISNGTT